ncbi:MAG: amino acid ABC transporter permease [Rhizobiaceae bacterium]
MNGFASFFQHLAASGIDLPYLYDSFDAARFWHGLLLTIELSVVTIAASTLIGIIGAWMQASRVAVARGIANVYVEMFRNTPPLVQIYFFYFGMSTLLPTVQNAYGQHLPLLGGFAWAALSLSLYAGSFSVEIFRSGIEAIPNATSEAAESLGFTRIKAYQHIILPLAIRICLPALTNNLVNLIKTTTLAYAIAVPELLYVSGQIWSDRGNVPEMMVTLLVIYLVLVGILVAFMRGLERALKKPGLGT